MPARKAPAPHIALIGLATGMATVFAASAWIYLPVGLEEQRAAKVLSGTGSRGAAAYREAIDDGRITRSEMQDLRNAAGSDVDHWPSMDTPAR